MKLSCALMAILISFGVSAQTPAKTNAMSEKWYKLQHLIDKEIQTISAVKNIGPSLQYRLLALKTEKIKLTKERENQLFLDHSVKGKTLGPKDSYFTQSKKESRNVEREASALMKRYPQFNYTADLLYMLALNDRDYLEGKNVERYLLAALKRAPGGSPLIHATKTSLAEFYYNDKQYDRALRYYQDVLRNKHDEWASKHTINASWCFFKVQNYSEAISLLEESFFLSKDKRYIDVSEQALEAMSVFYVKGSQVQRGIEFYLKNAGKETVSYLIKLAKRATDQGLFAETKQTLDTALKVAVSSKDLPAQVDIRLSELEIYRTFKRHDLFYLSAKDIYRLNKISKIDPAKKDDAILKIKELVGYLQIRVSRNSKINNRDYDKEELTQVINYFTILSGLDPEARDQYAFYQGETYFSVGRWQNAANAYVRALNTSLKITRFEHAQKVAEAKAKSKSKKEPNIKFVDNRIELKKKIMDSLLAVLEQGEFDAKETDKLSLYAFKNHVLIWPRDDRSRAIYPKLFNLYFKKNRMADAHWTIDAYKDNYQEDIEKQRQMLTLVLDQYMKAKDTEKVAFWIRKLETGYLKFDAATIEKATILLGNILFERYQNLDREGKKTEALAGYTSLYNDPQYPKKIKANAALNAAILADQLSQSLASYDWMMKSQSFMERDDALKNAIKYDALAESYALQGNFKQGAIAAYKNLTFLCKEITPIKNELYRRGVEYAIVLHDIKLAFETWKLSNNCGLSTELKTASAKQMILFSAKMRDSRHLEALHQVLAGVSELVPVFAVSYYDLYWDARSRVSSESKFYMKKLEDYLAHPDMPKDIRANLAAIKQGEILTKKIEKLGHFAFSKTQVFSEDLFNSELERHFLTLKSLTDESTELTKSKEIEVVLSIYESLAKVNLKLRDAILAYTPNGVPPEFVAGFKESMKSIAGELENRRVELVNLSLSLRAKNHWMGPGSWSMVDVVPEAKLVLRYPASALARASDQSFLSTGEVK